MTETGAGAVLIAHREPRAVGTNCFGPDNPEVEVRIVADHGADAAVDEPGELLVRHRGVDPRDGFYLGYLKDAQATNEAWAGAGFIPAMWSHAMPMGSTISLIAERT